MPKTYSRSLAGVVAGALATSITFGQNLTPRRTLDVAVPDVISRSLDTGHTNPATVLHLGIALPIDEVGLQSFVDSVSDPKSPNYRQFISPEQVGQRFGLPTSAMNRVVDYLKGQGFKIRLVSKNRAGIAVEGTVAQAEAAFGTRIDDFLALQPEPHGRAQFHANVTPISLPAGIAGYVQNVLNLSNFATPKPAAALVALSPQQIQSAYDSAPLINQLGRLGQGRTIGITSYDGFSISNAALFIQKYNLPTPAAGATTNIQIETIEGGGNTGTVHAEGDLDIQSVLSVASLANIVIYDGGNISTGTDPWDTWLFEVNDNVADVVTDSYGFGGLDNDILKAFHELHLIMSAQGMTYLCASGDDGTNSIGNNADCYPTIDPEVLSVGGTTLSISPATGLRTTETGWSDNGASGGGWTTLTAAFNVLPSYQKGTGVPTNIPYRMVPDVAFDADPDTGLNIYVEGALHQYGGTSMATPLLASSLAVAEQQLISTGGLSVSASGKRRFGRINDLIYGINGNPSVFYDVTSSGSTGKLPNGVQAVAGPGWDFVTGWGSLDVNGFVNYVMNAGLVTGVTASPSQLVGGATVKFTVSLQTPAPVGGIAVSIAASDPSAFPSLPATLTIPAGAKSATLTTTSAAVAGIDDVTITATGVNGSKTTVVTVTQPTIKTIAVSPGSVAGGISSTVTVTLGTAAPTVGATLNLTSSNPAVFPVPATLTVPGGATTATFTVTPAAVGANTPITITGISGAAVATGKVTVTPPAFSSFTVSASSTFGGPGITVTGTITLGSPAPAGYQATLTSSIPAAASVPGTVAIAAGAKTATFTIQTYAVSAKAAPSITVTTAVGSKSTTVTINPAVVTAVAVGTPSVLGGVGTTFTITLGTPAGPTGDVVAISSSNTAAAKFASTTVTVPAGQTSVSATVTTLAVSSNQTVTLTGNFGGAKTTTLGVTAANLTGFTIPVTSTKGGTTVTGTLTLQGPAGPSGRVVALTSSSTAVATVPASVTVPAGASSVTFTITTKAQTASKSVTVTATLGAAFSNSLTVTP